MTAGFLDLIRSDLDSVNLMIEKALMTKSGHLSRFAHLETKSLQGYLHPAVVLLTGRLFRYTEKKIVYLAYVIQLIYLAAAIQFRIPDNIDRVPDHEDPRDSAQLPVLVGDYLYGKYFVGLSDGEILEFLSPLSGIIAEMNCGALERRKNSGLPVTDCKLAVTVIEKETALLTQGALKLAGQLAGAPEAEKALLSDFGFNLGMAYGILERGLDPDLAEPYFEKAHSAIGKLPAGEARDSMEELLDGIHSGELPVPPRTTGESGGFLPGYEGGAVIPGEYGDREEYVHSVFTAIAGKYDSLNTVLSFNRDKRWRRVTVEKTGIQAGDRALDVCCGTGMITTELAKKAGPQGRVVGIDFCEDMLEIARENLKGSAYESSVEYIQGNAMDIPFPDNTFDCATIGFGLRNVPDMKKALKEMIRVVKPGGRVVCLEFSKPTVPVFKQIYNFYFDKCVPFLGKLGVGTEGPYRYLHNSWKAFPRQDELREEFRRQGLRDTDYYELTGGVVSVHVGVKPLAPALTPVAATKE